MQWLWKWLMILFSGMLLLTGIITFPLPIPIGLPLLMVGLAIMVRHSSDAKRFLVKLSRRFPLLHRIIGARKKVTKNRPKIALTRKVSHILVINRWERDVVLGYSLVP